jgi:hypothetical protein
MKLKDKVLFYLARNELARNRRFKDLHKGQSCYIFGNGISLKNMNLEKFSDKISIGCNSLFFHKHFDKLDCRYYQVPAPFLFFPYNNYYGSLQRNYLGDLYKEKFIQLNTTHFFTSITNRLNIRGDNIFYTHHFGNRNWDLNQCDLDGVFSFMAGATNAMLGTAIYMGFASAVLVGCDYTFSPRQDYHFFCKGTGALQKEIEDDASRLLFNECQKRIDLTTIVPAGMKSNLLKYMSYEEYVRSPATYMENTEIVDREYLDQLDKIGVYRIY